MLGLTKQVSRAEVFIDTLVCNDQRFGWTRKEVNSNPPEQLALCFGHKSVSWPDNHINRRDCLGPDGHGADPLNTTKRVDLVSSGQIHRNHDCGVRATVERRRGRNDAGNARDTRCHHTHMRRCDQGVFAARHIAANRIDGHVLVTKRYARQCFNLNILKRVTLNLSKIPDLFLSELDVADRLCVEFFITGVDFSACQTKALRTPFIESFRQLTDRRIAARIDAFENFLDGSTNLSICFLFEIRINAILEPARHNKILLCYGRRYRILHSNAIVDL